MHSLLQLDKMVKVVGWYDNEIDIPHELLI
jgi:glyceraldehyde-3-phosphate dehydrogenase/erythrose-4-phosphate dehydrogenase